MNDRLILILLIAVLFFILVVMLLSVARAHPTVTVLETADLQTVLLIAPPPTEAAVRMVYGTRSRVFAGAESATVTLYGRCGLAVIDGVLVGRRCAWMPVIGVE